MNKTARFGLDAVMAGVAAIVSAMVPLPLGLPSSTFIVICAPVAAVVGIELGRWLGSSRRRRATYGIYCLVAVILCALWYIWLLNAAHPGLLTTAAVYFSYTGIVISFFLAMGLLQVEMFGSNR